MELRLLPVLLLLTFLPLIHGGADKTLFDEFDRVTIFKEDTYIGGLYDGQKAHLFLLYSSWCGHCQRFAPTYIEFADAIAHWSNVVDVTGVDCVYDTAVCRKYSVRGYPTVRFIRPTTNSTTIGETYDGGRSSDDLKAWTIRMLGTVTDLPAAWPRIHPLTEEEARELKKGGQTRIVAIVGSEEVGREIMMDLQDAQIRYTVIGSPSAQALGAKATGLIVVSSEGKLSHILNSDASAVALEKQIKQIAAVGGDDKEGDGKEGAEGDSADQEEDMIEFVDTSKQYKLFEMDMQSAVNTAFYFEVASKSTFSREDMENLWNFVTIVQRCGSWAPDYNAQLAKVKHGLKGLNGGELTPEAWSGILASASEIGFPRNSTFIGCQGSSPNTRGFTCSLWLLFHTMLSSCYRTPPGSVRVLHTIHGYVSSFFTCSYCRDHFLAMAERMRLLQIRDDKTAILAFWEAHNTVNARLSVVEHDPFFPKVQFPPPSLCGECHDGTNGEFDTEAVFGFLMRHFRRVLTPYGRLRLVQLEGGDESDDGGVEKEVRYRLRAAPAGSDSRLPVSLLGALTVLLLCVCAMVVCRKRLKVVSVLFRRFY